MKANRIKLLSILLLTPFLMANSPSPYPHTEIYRELKVEYSFKGVDRDGYHYQLDVTNTGEYYSTLDFYPDARNGTTKRLLFGGNEMLAPGDTKSYEYISNNKLNDVAEWHSSAYPTSSIAENVTFANARLEKTGYANYEFKADISGLEDHYYIAIVDVTYKGTDYAFEVWLSGTDRIETNENLDLTELTINRVTAYQSEYAKYKGGAAFGVAMIVLPILGILGLVTIVGGAVVGIFFLTKLIIKIAKQNKSKSE